MPVHAHEDGLINTTENQRCSIITFLTMIQNFDEFYPTFLEGERNIENLMSVLNVNESQCLQNIRKNGAEGIIKDLLRLTDGQKANFVMLVIEFMLIDIDLSEDKICFVQEQMSGFGLSEEKFLETFFAMKSRRAISLINRMEKNVGKI